MKIRILGNSIRLRLTQTEVNNFYENGKVEERIHFGTSEETQLSYSLSRTATSSIRAQFQDNKIEVLIPSQIGNDWVQSDQVSMEAYMPLEGESQLRILIEKDFKCLKEREGEEESDMFPHPEQDNLRC